MVSTELPGIHSEDVLLPIFSLLPIPDLAQCAAVCKQWHNVVTGSTHLWRGKSYTSKKSWRISAETRAVLFALPLLHKAEVEVGAQCYVNVSYPRLSLSLGGFSDLGAVEDWEKVRCRYLSIHLNIAESFFSSHSPIDFSVLHKLNITKRSRSWTPVKSDTGAECTIGSALQQCPNLRELSICADSLSADYLDALDGMGRLRGLQIQCNHLQKLVFLRHCSEALEELELEGCFDMPSVAYAELRRLGNLRRLRLHYCRVEQGDLEVAAPGLKSLVSLQLNDCHISDLSPLRHCGRLREVSIYVSRQLKMPTGLAQLPPSVRSLRLTGDSATADRLSDVLPRLPSLDQLSVSCARLDCLDFLRGCPQLRRLCLDYSSWPDASQLLSLRHLPRLETLELTGRSDDVAALSGVIPSLPRLDTLSLGYRQDVEHLLRGFPRLHSLLLFDNDGNLCDKSKLWKFDLGRVRGKYVCKFARGVV